MRKSLILLSFAALGLSGCINNDVARGLTGAAAGGLLADVTNGNVLMARLLAALRAPSAMTLAFAAHVTDLIAASRAQRTYPMTQWPFAQSARVAILISSPRGRRSAFCFSERDSHV